MADSKISELTGASVPLAGTELLVAVQGGATVKVTLSDLLTAYLTKNNSGILAGTAPYNTLRFTDVDTTASADQPLGRVEFYSSDASYEGVKAYVEARAVDGSPDGDLFLATQHNTGSGLADKLKIGYSGDITALLGNLVIGTSGKGIDFSADGSAAGMTSELLDDYEEGTWTPVLGGSGGTSGQTYSTQAGTYTKIGNLVCAVFETTLSAKGTITTNAQIQGLPFSVNASSNGGLAFSKIAWLSSVTSQLVGVLSVGGTVATLRQAGLNGDNTNLTTTNINNNTSIVGCFIYRT
jgi:hypothetical protein